METGVHDLLNQSYSCRNLLSNFCRIYFWGKYLFLDTTDICYFSFCSQEVAETCLLKLNLILIAIEARKYEGGQIWINPLNKKVAPNAIGLFLTESSDAAKRAWFYCREVFYIFHLILLIRTVFLLNYHRKCHSKVVYMSDIRKCPCKNIAKARFEEYSNDGQTYKTNVKYSFKYDEFLMTFN